MAIEDITYSLPPMSLRDYFAGQALGAIVAARLAQTPDNKDLEGYGSWVDACGWGAAITNETIDGGEATPARHVAVDAYVIADAMLAARLVIKEP
jgi:hypothetical protein